jgi:hypothetical protein
MQVAVELNKINLPSLIQMIAVSGLTGKIIFSQDQTRKEALICVDKGVVVHAQSDARQGLEALHDLLLRDSGIASFVEDDLQSMPRSFFKKGSEIDLPDWVLARLKQDNGNISQAITDMVIWVDRLKCWIYQADADMERIISSLNRSGGGLS